MRSEWPLALVLAFMAMSPSCGTPEGNHAPPPTPISVTLSPSSANVRASQSMAFTAWVSSDSSNYKVAWSLSGAGCTGPACGTISSTGGDNALYIAPSSVPGTPTVTVTVTVSRGGSTATETANVTILAARPGAPEWTWVSGSQTISSWPVYGTKGVAAPSNVPGARGGAASWTDPSGAFWLFGGDGRDWHGSWGLLSDLWKFDPATQEWTWVSGSDLVEQSGAYGTKGVPDTANFPPARWGAVSWVDPRGKLWLFGGEGYVSATYRLADLNDLWMFDPTTLEWTWVSGSDTGHQPGTYGTKGTADPSNLPGARCSAVSWLDPGGRLWLFGGSGLDSYSIGGKLNDLWMFDPATREWTWVSGSNSINQPGTYGTRGTADALNIPGGREAAVSWTDFQGKFWLLGGSGSTTLGSSGAFNDLWRFDPATLEWTWVSGSDVPDQKGTYGSQGVADPFNHPGARCGAISWVDAQGRFWLFGGWGTTAGLENGGFNDLWGFDPATLQWTWVSGSDTQGQPGTYGTKGIASPPNVPGARSGAMSWIDAQDRLWLFGGGGLDSAGNPGALNDLWRLR